MTIQGEDKRGFIRIPLNSDVEVQVQGRTYRACRSLEGINLSMSGIRLCTGEAIPDAGSACLVKIFLEAPENGLIIEAHGTVMRSEPGSLAVEFTELDLDSYYHLKSLILNNTDEPEKAEKEFQSHWGIRSPRSKSH